MVYFYWQIHQIDVNNAFLNKELKENVHIVQPQRIIDPTKPTHV